jgi:capsid protein
VEWTPLRDLTIDRGKAREAVEEVKSGMGTHSGYWRSKGADWKDAARQRVAEEKFHQELCDAEGVDYDRVFPPLPGATLIPAAQEAAGDGKTG